MQLHAPYNRSCSPGLLNARSSTVPVSGLATRAARDFSPVDPRTGPCCIAYPYAPKRTTMGPLGKWACEMDGLRMQLRIDFVLAGGSDPAPEI